VTLQISDPDVLQVHPKTVGLPTLESIQGFELGAIKYPCSLVLHPQNQGSVVLLNRMQISLR
jgi:hypothetical protein